MSFRDGLYMRQRQKVNSIMQAQVPMLNAGPAHAEALFDMARQHRIIAHNALRSYDKGTTWGQVTFKIHMKKAREYFRKARMG